MSGEEEPSHAGPSGTGWADGVLATVIGEPLGDDASDDASGSSASVSSVSTLVIDRRTLSALLRASPGVRARFLAALRSGRGVAKVRLDLAASAPAPADAFGAPSGTDALLLCDRLGAALGGLPDCETLEVALGGGDTGALEVAARVLRGARRIGTLQWTQRPLAAPNAAVVATARPLTDLLTDSLRHHCHLTSVRVELSSGADLRAVCGMLASCPHLSEIELGSSRWDDLVLGNDPRDLEALARVLRMESLTELRFRRTQFAMDGGAVGLLCDALDQATLSKLSFSRVSFDATDQRALGRALFTSAITSLDMDEVELSSAFFAGMTDELVGCSTLESIDWAGCKLQDHNTRGIETFLVQSPQYPKLKAIRLPNCAWTKALDMALADSLRRSSSIQDLHITGKAESHNSNPFSCLADAIRSTESLNTLHLDVANVGASQYEAIGDALGHNVTMETLSMRWREWSLRSFAAFLHRIRDNKRLQVLTVEVDRFTILGSHMATFQDSVLDAVRKNFYLKSLRIVGCDGSTCGPLEWELNQNLQAVTRLNEAGRHYLLKEYTSRNMSTAVLAAVKDDLNCLYMHLRENPHLCKTNSASESMLYSPKKSTVSSFLPKWKLGCFVALLCIGSGLQRLMD